jgi:hypothetical protein
MSHGEGRLEFVLDPERGQSISPILRRTSHDQMPEGTCTCVDMLLEAAEELLAYRVTPADLGYPGTELTSGISVCRRV